LRTFALELKEQLAQTLAAFVTSILAESHGRGDAEEAAEPPLRQIIDVLQQVMCAHDAEKLAISMLEIHGGTRSGCNEGCGKEGKWTPDRLKHSFFDQFTV